ncbi:MAG: tRNA guanosine(34) transglycosylase Tgt [Clostridiales bacterium]|jgi:queuine tRNA-ribosyltransferase|nr:tRNA guanosine(34) transglycosylase Tgt [Clostridiales bacterium]
MYSILHKDGHAKTGILRTPHGDIRTPVFMNVGTQAAIKGAVSSLDLKTIKCQVELSNTYHLHVRPGDELVRDMGGLHSFMSWDGPILTDSGGFQVFSLAGLRKISEEGVRFASHVDGRRIFMGPEESMTIQANLGSDIAMAFDECIPALSERDYVEKSTERTTRWLERCIVKHGELKEAGGSVNPGQLLFGINQGGIFHDIRADHARRITAMNLDGYAIGGLAVGETHEEMYNVLETVVPLLPTDKPCYLMGVGTPANIVEAVYRGVDFFDCVLPARNGRHANVYTMEGKLNLLNKQYERDGRPIDEGCGCPACANHSRAYIRHLFKAGELLALRLCVLHNLYFYNNLMEKIRDSIARGAFGALREQVISNYARRVE